MQNQDDRQKVWELIKDISVALMVTRDPDGRMHGRPMTTQQPKDGQSFDGTLWFMTSIETPKIQEIEDDPEVFLSYAKPDSQSYVSVAGRAEVVHDQARVKEFWTEAYKTWFPDGPEDPRICLIKVDIEAAEFWDAPSSAVIYAYGYFKARLTGERPKVGENRTVNFR